MPNTPDTSVKPAASKGGRMAQPSFMSEFSIAMEHGYNPEEMDAKLREVYGKTSQQIIDVFGPFAKVQDFHPPPEPDDSGREIVRLSEFSQTDDEEDEVFSQADSGDDDAFSQTDDEEDKGLIENIVDAKQDLDSFLAKKTGLGKISEKGREKASSNMLSNMAREQAVFEKSAQVDRAEPMKWAFFELPGGLWGAIEGLPAGLDETMHEIMKYPYNLVAGPLDLKKAEMGTKWDYEQRKKRKNIINKVEEHVKKDLLKRRENTALYNSVTDAFTVTEAMFKLFLNTLGASPVSPKSREWAKKTGAESANELASSASFKESFDLWEEMIPGFFGTLKAYWDLSTRGAIWRADEFKSPADQFMKTAEGFHAISTRPFTGLMVMAPVLKYAKLKSKQANRAFNEKFNLPEKDTGVSYEVNRAILMAQDLISARFRGSQAFVAGRESGVYKAAGLVGDHLNPYSFTRGMIYGDVVGGAAMGVGLAMMDSFLRSKLPKTKKTQFVLETFTNWAIDPVFSTVSGMSEILRSIYDSARLRQGAITAEGRRLGKIIEASEAKVSIKDPGQPDFPGQTSSKKKAAKEESFREDYSPRTEPQEAYTPGSGKGKKPPELNKADHDYILEYISIEELGEFYKHLADVQAELVANASKKGNADIPVDQHRAMIDQSMSNYQKAQAKAVEAAKRKESIQNTMSKSDISKIEELARAFDADSDSITVRRPGKEKESLQDMIREAEMLQIEEMKRAGEADIRDGKYGPVVETEAIQAFRQETAAKKAVEQARLDLNKAMEGASFKQAPGKKDLFVERKSKKDIIPGQSRASVKEAQGIGKTLSEGQVKQGKPTGGVELKTKKGARKGSQARIIGDAEGRVYYEVDGVATKAMGQSQPKGETYRVRMEPDIKVLKEGTKAFNDLKNVSKEMDGAIESLAKDEGYGAIEFEDGTVWVNEDLVVNRGRAVEQTYPIPRKDMPRIEPNINVKSKDRTKLKTLVEKEKVTLAPAWAKEKQRTTKKKSPNEGRTPTDTAELSKEYIQKNRVQMIMDINSRGQIEGSPRFSEIHGRIIQTELKGGRKEARDKIKESIDEMFDLETKYDTTLPNELGTEKSSTIGRSKKEMQRVYLDVLRENSTFLYQNPKARKGLKESMGRDAGLKGPALKRFMEDGAIDEALLSAVRDSFKEGKLVEGELNPRFQSFAIKVGNKTVSMDMAGPRFVKHLKKTNPKALAKLQGEAVEIVIGGLARKNSKLTFLKTIGDMVDHRPVKEIAKSIASGRLSPILPEGVTKASLKGELNKIVSDAKIKAAKLYKEAQGLKEKGASKEIYKAKMEEYRVANNLAKDVEKNKNLLIDRYRPAKDGLRDLRNEISRDVYRGKEAQFEADIGRWSSEMLVDRQVKDAIMASKFALDFASDAANVNRAIKWGMRVGRFLKRSFAVLNPGTVTRNFGQAVSAIALQEGRLPSSVIIDMHKKKGVWEAYIKGEDLSPHDKRVARIMRDSGMDVDAAIQEMGDIFSSDLSDGKSRVGSAIGKTITVARKGLDQAQKPYRYGDVAPRSYMMHNEISATIRYMDMMKPGEPATIFIDPNKSVTIFKRKDGGFSMHGKKLTNRQTERLIGRAAKVRPDLTIFDYGDIPIWHRFMREVPLGGAAFPTWINKAAHGNRKNLAMTLIEGNGGVNFITTNAAINAEIASIYGKTAINRAVLSATAIPIVLNEDDAYRKHMAFDPSSGEIRSTISTVVNVDKNGKATVKTMDLSGAQYVEGWARDMRFMEGAGNSVKRLLTVGYSNAKKYFSDGKDVDSIWLNAEKEGGDPVAIKKAKNLWIKNKAYGDWPIRDALSIISLNGDLMLDAFMYWNSPRTRASAYQEDKITRHAVKGILTGVGEPLFTAAVEALTRENEYVDRPFDDHLQTIASKMFDKLKGLSFRTFVFGGDNLDRMSYHNEKLDEAIKASIRVAAKKRVKRYERDVARLKKAAKEKEPGAKEGLVKANNALKNSQKMLDRVDRIVENYQEFLRKRRERAMDNFVTRSLQ